MPHGQPVGQAISLTQGKDLQDGGAPRLAEIHQGQRVRAGEPHHGEEAPMGTESEYLLGLRAPIVAAAVVVDTGTMRERAPS